MSKSARFAHPMYEMTLDVPHKGPLTWTLRAGALLLLATFGGAPALAVSQDTPRDLYLRGKAAGKPEDQRTYYRQGVDLARGRLQAKPDDPEGLLYLAANLGAAALVDGKMAALRVLPDMERLLLRLHAVAPSYEQGAAARTLGRLYHVAPSFISIGSRDKARQWLETALKLAPRHPGTLVFAADFYRDQGDDERARRYASQALSALKQGDYAPHEDEWRDLATDVLDAVGEE